VTELLLTIRLQTVVPKTAERRICELQAKLWATNEH